MLDLCLALLPRLPEWMLLNESLIILLYFPWFSFAATWIISVAFYDGEMWLNNIVINYLVFLILFAISHATEVTSPMAIPCHSFFFNIYRYVGPSATFVVTLAYYALVVLHHRRRKREWWQGRTKTTSIVLALVILGFPSGYITSIWYYDIMHPWMLLFNMLLVTLLVVGWNEFTQRSKPWQALIIKVATWMQWQY